MDFSGYITVNKVHDEGQLRVLYRWMRFARQFQIGKAAFTTVVPQSTLLSCSCPLERPHDTEMDKNAYLPNTMSSISGAVEVLVKGEMVSYSTNEMHGWKKTEEEATRLPHLHRMIP